MITSNVDSPLLLQALDAYGGLDRWHNIERLAVRFSIDGGLYSIKGFPEGLRDATMLVDVHRPHAQISPFFARRRTGWFTPERVWIEDGDRNVVTELDAPRASFAGHHLQTKWNELQFLYFTGYALWNYFTTPFVFAEPGFAFEAAGEHEENGEVWQKVHVTWPANLPTHADQTFYFNDKGLIARIDYTTDVAGGVASHYVFDHRSYGGILFPTLRRVVPRRERPLINGPTAVLLQIHDIVVD